MEEENSGEDNKVAFSALNTKFDILQIVENCLQTRNNFC